MWRFRGIVVSAMLILTSVGLGVAVARAQGDAGASGATQAPASTAPWTNDVPRATTLLSRLHHAAAREMVLGDLAESKATHPETRRYGAELASEFRAYDQRLISFAAGVGIDSSRLAKTYAGENVAAMRREADDLARFANARGDEFDRGFWVAVAQEQSASTDMLPAIAQGGPELTRLAAELGQLLDRSSLRALDIARAQLPGEKALPASQTSPAGQANPATDITPTR
jgi:hypothetical protein